MRIRRNGENEKFFKDGEEENGDYSIYWFFSIRIFVVFVFQFTADVKRTEENEEIQLNGSLNCSVSLWDIILI